MSTPHRKFGELSLVCLLKTHFPGFPKWLLRELCLSVTTFTNFSLLLLANILNVPKLLESYLRDRTNLRSQGHSEAGTRT